MHESDHQPGCETCREPELLLWYAAERLDEERAQRVEECIAACEHCRSALDENQTLVRAAQGLPSALASRSPEELVRLALEPAEHAGGSALLDETDREIVGVLQRVDEELKNVRAPFRERWRRFWQSLTPPAGAGIASWVSSPVAAYLLVLALAYPAYRGVVGTDDISSAPMVVDAPHDLGRVLRGGTEAESGSASALQLSRDSNNDRIVLSAFVPINVRSSYTLRVVDGAGSVRWEKRGAETFDGVGTFVIALPSHFLPTGDYTLQVEAVDGSGSEEISRFVFRIE